MRDSRKDLPQVQKAKSGFKKATLVGVLALFFTFSFSSRALAQDESGSTHVDPVTALIQKLTPTTVSDDIVTTKPTTDEDKIFFLYNENGIFGGKQVQGKFLNLGGYWGSHVALSTVPYPFRLEKADDGTYFIVSNKTVSDKTVADNGIGSGNYVGWATNNDQSISSYGVFASLPNTSSDKSQLAWHFEPIKDTNKYHIYLDLKDVKVPTLSTTDETTTFNWTSESGKFYLEATTSQNVYGDNNEKDEDNKVSYGSDDQTVSIITDYPGAEARKDESPSTTVSEWKLISLKEYNKLFEEGYQDMVNDDRAFNFILSQNSQSNSQSDGKEEIDLQSPFINVSYLLHDPDFRFYDPELSYWHFKDAIKDNLYIGFDNYVKKANSDGTFTSNYGNEDGSESNLTAAKIANRARYMGAMVKGDMEAEENNEENNKKIYQTINITKPGFYTFTGSIYSNADSGNDKTYVSYNNRQYESYRSISTLRTQDTGNTWPKTNGNNDILYNTCASAHSGGGNENNGLNFYISPDLLARNNGKIEVELGIIVNHQESGDKNAKPYNFMALKSESTSSTNTLITIIDNFRLFFRGQNKNKPDLILDEDNENLDYLDKCSDEYANLRLHRTFSTGNWNSIILPVGLTKEQYTSTFGDAPLAELNALTQSEIQFKTVTEESKYVKDGVVDNTEYWLKPMTPYIIKANKATGDYSGDDINYTGTYHYWRKYVAEDATKKVNNAADYNYTMTIDGTQKPYFKIDDIKMVSGVIPTSDHTDGDNKDFVYDNKIGPMWNFKGITAKTNTTEKDADGNVLADDYECPYVIKTESVESKKASIAAFGTLARNYTYTKSDGTTSTTQLLIAGRPSLKDSYAMSGGKLTYYSAGTAMKGFRCWFEYTTSSTGGTSSAKPMPTLLLDGVNMATGIDEIMANDEGISMINQYQKGIFSLGGQRISQDASSFDALPKGIYIVNGKKVIKD